MAGSRAPAAILRRRLSRQAAWLKHRPATGVATTSRFKIGEKWLWSPKPQAKPIWVIDGPLTFPSGLAAKTGAGCPC